MSIKFFLKDHQDKVKIENGAFNPTEPEDPIYNPRYEHEPIYPELNLSNTNGVRFIRFLELLPNDVINSEGIYANEIQKDQIDDLARKVFSIRVQLGKGAYIFKEPKLYSSVEISYLLDILERFEKLCRYAVALDDSIVWA
jgi:hypothetical protein